MENIEDLNTYNLILPTVAGSPYARVATIYSSGISNENGINFTLKLNGVGVRYSQLKFRNQKLFINIRHVSGVPVIDVAYDSEDCVNEGNNTEYSFDPSLVGFSVDYDVIDAVANTISYQIHIYLKTDPSINRGYGFCDVTTLGYMDLQYNICTDRDTFTSIPSSDIAFTRNDYDLRTFRTTYNLTTDDTGFTSANFRKKKDPVTRTIRISGKIILKPTYTLGTRLMYIERISATEYPNTGELVFPVIVYYGTYGDTIGVGAMEVTSTGVLILRNYDRAPATPLSGINSIQIPNISYSY